MAQQKDGSSDNFECRNSFPDSSIENISNQISDEKVVKCELQKCSDIISNIVESKLRHFFQEKIDKDVCQIITDHCNYKLAEIIKAATNNMAECGRLKFTVEDFKKGLVISGVYSNCDVLLSNVKKRNRKPKNPRNICNKTRLVYLKEIWLNGISPLSTSIKNLSSELKEYFKAVTETLFLNDEEFIFVVLRDLEKNKDIFQLVPYFINFFYDGIGRFKCDFLKISILLKLINALLRNPYVYFGQDSYLNTLTCLLLKFVVSDLPLYNQGKDCWLLKDTAANLIAFILNRCKNQHLFFEVLYFIQSVFLTFKNSLNSHYGTLAVLNSIGVPAILLLLPLYVHRFHEHVGRILSSNNQTRIDVHMVQGQIIHSYHILVNYFLKKEIKKSEFESAHHFESNFFLPDYLKDIKVFPVLSQSYFVDYFGEALLPALPSSHFASHSIYLSKKKQSKIKEIKKMH